MTEVRFYHLTERPLEGVLPVMLEKCVERGWRAVVRGTDPGQIDRLDAHLWTWRAESFLPHGTARDGDGSAHPIWLTTGPDAPNAPDTLFLIGGAEATDETLASVDTAAILFDGHDPDAVTRAREQWRGVVAAGLKAVYWAQDAGGQWVRRAESG